MNANYKDAMSKICASEEFKQKTLQKLEKEKRRRYDMKGNKKVLAGLAMGLAAAVCIIGVGTPQAGGEELAALDLTDRIEIDANAVAGCCVVNIEGTIVEVGEDGLSFELDNGQWVEVTDDTEIGITSPTAADKEDQFFEPTFRVGNQIAGFTLTEDEDEVTAYAIYSNWNWEDPIR